ncbi:MAG: hypothetical protein GF320_08075 [Armatimonadia bacterium]|nr:hypothetical protein [Armatimonadia bacterium]
MRRSSRPQEETSQILTPDTIGPAEDELLWELGRSADMAMAESYTVFYEEYEADLSIESAEAVLEAQGPEVEVQLRLVQAEDGSLLDRVQASRIDALAAEEVFLREYEQDLYLAPPPEPPIGDLRLLPPRMTVGRQAELMDSLEAWSEAIAEAQIGGEYALWPDEPPPSGASQLPPPMLPTPDVVGPAARFAVELLETLAGESVTTVQRRGRGRTRYSRIATLEAPEEAAAAGGEVAESVVRDTVRQSRGLSSVPGADFGASDAVIEVAAGAEELGELRRDTALPGSDLSAQDMVIDATSDDASTPLPKLSDLARSYHSTPSVEGGGAEVIQVELRPDAPRESILGMISSAKNKATQDSPEDAELLGELGAYIDELHGLSQVEGGDPALMDALHHWADIGPAVCRAVNTAEGHRRVLATLFGLLAEHVIGINPNDLSSEDARARERLIEILADLAASLGSD